MREVIFIMKILVHITIFSVIFHMNNSFQRKIGLYQISIVQNCQLFTLKQNVDLSNILGHSIYYYAPIELSHVCRLHGNIM